MSQTYDCFEIECREVLYSNEGRSIHYRTKHPEQYAAARAEFRALTNYWNKEANKIEQ